MVSKRLIKVQEKRESANVVYLIFKLIKLMLKFNYKVLIDILLLLLINKD